MEKSFLWSSTGFSSWAFVVNYLYSDLPLILDRYSFPVIFADNPSVFDILCTVHVCWKLCMACNPSVVIMDTNITNFLINSRDIFSQLNKWFSANQLLLNYVKTNFLHFRRKNSLILGY
jgi:hypothetical protein